jgi:hypothetical protein
LDRGLGLAGLVGKAWKEGLGKKAWKEGLGRKDLEGNPRKEGIRKQGLDQDQGTFQAKPGMGGSRQISSTNLR